MSEQKTYYPTIKAARAALALEIGFDPFISGGWGRPSKAKLAAAGYPVDPKQCLGAARGLERRRRAGLCSVCGQKALTRLMCSAHGIGNCGRCEPESTGRCKAHTEWSLRCD